MMSACMRYESFTPFKASRRSLVLPANVELNLLRFFTSLLSASDVSEGNSGRSFACSHARNVFLPNSPFRKEELSIKAKLIKNAIKILAQKQLIDVIYNEKGIYYLKNELTSLFINKLTSTYSKKLIKQAKWVYQFIVLLPLAESKGSIFHNEIAGYQRRKVFRQCSPVCDPQLLRDFLPGETGISCIQ